MKTLLIIGILVYFELNAQLMIYVCQVHNISSVYTHQVFFAILDLITIYAISTVDYSKLVIPLAILLTIGILNHTIGGFAYWVDNVAMLSFYDSAKNWIFAAEVAVIFFTIAKAGMNGMVISRFRRVIESESVTARTNRLTVGIRKCN